MAGFNPPSPAFARREQASARRARFGFDAALDGKSLSARFQN
jgi:hypothetical protein